MYVRKGLSDLFLALAIAMAAPWGQCGEISESVDK